MAKLSRIERRRPVGRQVQWKKERKVCGGGEAWIVLGIFALFFGLVLTAAYTVTGVGVMAVWLAALFGFLDGFYLVYHAFKQCKA
jgi:hypothetical protein